MLLLAAVSKDDGHGSDHSSFETRLLVASNRRCVEPPCPIGLRHDESQSLTRGLARTSCFAFGNVFAHDALVTFQPPLMIGTISEPLGNTDLRVDLTGSHGDARLLTVGNDFLHA